MRLPPAFLAVALTLCLACLSPAGAAQTPGPQLKSDITHLLDELPGYTNGLVKWQGADRFDVREDGDAAVADFTNARLSLGDESKPAAQRAVVTLDHLTVRRAPASGGSSKLSFVLPATAVIKAPDHGEVRLTLKGATASMVLDAPSGFATATDAAFAEARIDDKATGDWITLGPLSLSSKLETAAGGGWTAPVDFELKKVAFFFTQGPSSGLIDRIAYTARSAGPDLAGLNRLRTRLAALRQQNLPPDKRLDASLELLPQILSLFSEAKGEATMADLAVRGPTGEPLVAIKQVSLGGALTGLSGNTAAWRITLKQDGLSVASSLLDTNKVPRRVDVDFGLEDVATAPLHDILTAASKLRHDAPAADKQQAQQQIIGAAAMLTPTLRLYDFSFDTPDVGVAAKGEAKGSPLSPKGYSAGGDVVVRGFDALVGLVGNAPDAGFLPVLKEIAEPTKADDGSQRLAFHLASSPEKPFTINGNDVSAWLRPPDLGTHRPRDLRPATPPLAGGDVVAVQQALNAAHVAAPQTAVYDGATAAAVARFQKANGLGVNGVVNAATREKLGIKAAKGD